MFECPSGIRKLCLYLEKELLPLRAGKQFLPELLLLRDGVQVLIPLNLDNLDSLIDPLDHFLSY